MMETFADTQFSVKDLLRLRVCATGEPVHHGGACIEVGEHMLLNGKFGIGSYIIWIMWICMKAQCKCELIYMLRYLKR